MKILQVIPNLGVGGAERLVLHLTLYIKEHTAHEVRVLSFYGRAGTDIEESLAAHGIPVYYLDKHRGPDLRMFGRISTLLAQYDPQVVHSHLYILRYLAPAILSRNRRRWIHTVHNVTVKETDRIGQFIHKHLFRRWITPVAISRELGRSLESHYGLHHPVVIMNGIPVVGFVRDAGAGWSWRQANGFHKDWVVFTCVARFNEQKNHLQLLDSFAAVSQKAPEARLLLVGNGTLRGTILERAGALGLRDKLHLLDVRRDVPEILAASDVFVLPSLWEGTPLSLMEAMAAGLPCVATRVGGVPELVQDGITGLLVVPGNVPALASAMKRLHSDAQLRAALGTQARDYARQHFGLASMAQAYLQLYSSTMDNTTSGKANPIVK